MTPRQRCELLLFAACFIAFAYFNQGGGWNQNARFAEVRAMVEEGRFAINDFLVYQRDDATGDLARRPVTRAEYDWEGVRNRLCWVDMEWTLFPVGPHPLEPGVRKVAMLEQCCSGDIGYVPANDQFHPNKPPGTSFFAVPGYFLLYHAERWLGIDPDHWWTLGVNAWLTSVLSVGLVSALGCVLFFRLAVDLSGGNLAAALGASVALAFGTTFFPFATLLFDHALTASLLVAALYFVRQSSPRAFFWAGGCGGLAVLTNYVAVGAVAILGFYALYRSFRQRDWRVVSIFVLGGLGPALLLFWYGWSCYRSPLALSNDFQNPLFRDDSLFLGMFTIPHTTEDVWRLFWVAKVLIYSPFRGVFWFAPVLLFGLCGLVYWLWRGALRAEALVCLGIFGFFFVVNVFFNGYHAGFAAGPRYLVPGLPFLALPLVVAFSFWRCVTMAFAALSIGLNLLLTATDAQNPTGVGGHARVEGRHREDKYNPIGEYAWPLFTSGRAWPLLKQEFEVELDREEAKQDDAGLSNLDRQQRREETREELVAAVNRGDSSPLLLASIEGPVSVNPVGVFEGLFNYLYFPPHSAPVRWASFNVGEFFWPQSRWSLLPLVLMAGGACGWAWKLASREEKGKNPIRSD